MNRHQFQAIQPMRRASIRGFNVWAVAINLFLLGALLVTALRVAPSYMEYLTVKDLLLRAADDWDPRTETVTDLRVRLSKLLNTNQIDDNSVHDLEGYRKRGRSLCVRS